MIFLSLSQSAPYLATSHLSLHKIGSKHIPFYFAFPIVLKQYALDRVTTALGMLFTHVAGFQLDVRNWQTNVYMETANL